VCGPVAFLRGGRPLGVVLSTPVPVAWREFRSCLDPSAATKWDGDLREGAPSGALGSRDIQPTEV
jgi:hypothetical protein